MVPGGGGREGDASSLLSAEPAVGEGREVRPRGGKEIRT